MLFFTLSLYYLVHFNCSFSNHFFSEIRGPHLYVLCSLVIAECPKHILCFAPVGSRQGLKVYNNVMSLFGEHIQGWQKCENITISLWTVSKKKNGWINWVNYSLWISCPVLSLALKHNGDQLIKNFRTKFMVLNRKKHCAQDIWRLNLDIYLNLSILMWCIWSLIDLTKF